jgi:hypothetical protein
VAVECVLYESATLLLLILLLNVPLLLTVINVPPLILMSDAPAKNDILSNRETVGWDQVFWSELIDDERSDEGARGKEVRRRPYTSPQTVA